MMRWEKPTCLMLRSTRLRKRFSSFIRIQDRFREDYASMLDATAQRNLPTAVCTVYDPRSPDPLQRRMGSLGLSVINDVVTREAFWRDLSLIDLRVMFDADEDFANPIEPSVRGGLKLARAIHRFASTPASRDASDPIRGGLTGRIFTARMYYPFAI